MKVQAETVVEFLDKVKALVEDINLTLRMGDDGMEDTVNYQVASITKAIEVFKLEQLSSSGKAAIMPTKELNDV